MKVLVIGSSGLTGSKFLDKFSKKTKTLGTYFSKNEKAKTYKNVIFLDVMQHSVVEQVIVEFRPDVIIYCASITPPDLCETEKEMALSVNYKGVKNVTSVCAALGIRLVYMSADYVFDGEQEFFTEKDSPNPINFFGETKLKAEKFILDILPDSIIIRSGLIYGFSPYTEGRGFLNYVLENLSASKEVEVDNEITTYPILADDLVDITFDLILQGKAGVFHIGNSEGYTKYEFACEIADVFNLDKKFIKIVNNSQMDLPAKRPSKVRLENYNLSQLENSINYHISSVREGILVHKKQYGCLFRMIYSVRPDMLVAGQNASQFRIEAGRALAKESPVDGADCVVPIPESGIYSATGVSAESGLPLFFGVIRDYFTEKTLYSSTTKDRYAALRKKLIPVKSIIEGKNIVIVDEAVISGSTLSVIIERLKEEGVGSIHVRIPSPVMSQPCDGKVLPQMKLMYKNALAEEGVSSLSQSEFQKFLANKFGVASFAFLSLDTFLKLPREKGQSYCYGCFLNKP